MTTGNQFHIDAENLGFVRIRTELALAPKWSLDVGSIGYGTPVFGRDGTLYIGTLSGELVAINPDGTFKWRTNITSPDVSRNAGAITGSPAVDGGNNIYVVCTSFQLNALIDQS